MIGRNTIWLPMYEHREGPESAPTVIHWYQQPERHIHLTMPWKREIFDPFKDEVIKRHPRIAVYWHRPISNGIKLRIGWMV